MDHLVCCGVQLLCKNETTTTFRHSTSYNAGGSICSRLPSTCTLSIFGTAQRCRVTKRARVDEGLVPQKLGNSRYVSTISSLPYPYPEDFFASNDDDPRTRRVSSHCSDILSSI
mmetsp:Transcript_30794/g.65075  ORF Transcript_30794/g.65075 Transcript_30794/m.65075 type:complete len:114 (+) Transcript_30794:295-636(+)